MLGHLREQYLMAKILVTGAAGRLGSIVARTVHNNGHDVLATDVVEADGLPCAFQQVDLVDHEATRELLTGTDVVIHIGNLAGIGRMPPQVVFSRNVTMNINVFQGAAEQGVGRIVFASTLQLIGSWPDERTVVKPARPPIFPLSGSTEPDPSNLYALSKTISERTLQYFADRCGLTAVALRFPLLHHDDNPHLVGSGTEDATAKFEGFTSLTYREAADLCLATAERQLDGYHVFMPGSSRRHADLKLPELIAAYYPGLDPSIPDLIDNTPIADATGWQPDAFH